MSLEYLRLTPDGEIPQASRRNPFRAVVVIEEPVSTEWQADVSAWLVASGCLYMMAWGLDAGSWDDSVDIANLEVFDYEEIPEQNFVMTTWHDNEPLSEVFVFSKSNAFHSAVDISDTLIVHISLASREKEFVSAYAGA